MSDKRSDLAHIPIVYPEATLQVFDRSLLKYFKQMSHSYAQSI